MISPHPVSPHSIGDPASPSPGPRQSNPASPSPRPPRSDPESPLPGPPQSDPASPSPGLLQSDRCKLIISHCIEYAIATILSLLMVIFLAIPALMPPEFWLDPGSSLSSLNISTTYVTVRWNIALSIKNPSKLIAVKYPHMKLLLSFNSQLALSRPSIIPAFTQGPDNVTTVRAEALSMIAMVNDFGVKGLVSSLKGEEVTIDVVAKSKRRLHLGPWWVPVLDAYVSCMGVTFTAPTNSTGDGDWMILTGTSSCTASIITLLW
ncbi:hypothetical protein ACJRO7_009596 [Eucalyptus globulus]|uniref:Late embryogenesis abundant protein LEA-2 subgroup domain-containing protein n=1 Tax=Eucalyptus globulus TaxID=34317 RepID=A0ABD3L988_EUCGL